MSVNSEITVKSKSMKRSVAILSGLGVLVVFCWVFPPFRVRSLKQVRAAQASKHFNATNFVAGFWAGKLLPATKHAAEATKVVETITHDPKKVRTEFGRSVGIGSTYFLFLRGIGRVVSVSDESIGLSLENTGDTEDISVALGPVFGNAVRDGTGLLSPSDYSNAQDYNSISAALNHIVETKVLPKFQRIAKVGARVQFAGCAEVDDESQDLKPLNLVPIYAKTE